MNALRLTQPTPALVVEHVELFDLGDPGLTDQALTSLSAAFPDNRDLPGVLAKAAIINSLYGANIYAISDVARRICALNIDPKLAQGSLDVINDIAVIQGELRHYPRYKEIIERFRIHYGLEQFGFKELDKFLWLYGKEVFGSTKPAQSLPTDAHP